MAYTITINDQRIWNFYNKHKNISFIEMNLLYIDIYEKIFNNSTGSLTETLSKHLIDNITQMQTELFSVKESLINQQKENQTNFILKFQDFKKEYMEELKMVLNNNTSEKIAPLIEKSVDVLQDKTKLIMNEKVLQTIDEKFSKTLLNYQNVFNNIVSSSESRLNNRINEINTENDKKMSELRELTTTNNSTQSNIHNNLTEFLKKMENSSYKGRISENILYNVLQTLYPIAQIDYVGTTKESGDIILTRKNKPIILFENKNYDTNVGKSEIDKFYRDVAIQNCCGILLSQKTAIVNKENFEIEIYDGKIMIFLHNVEYNSDKIRVAIDMIDHFNEMLTQINKNNNNDNIEIKKELLNEINNEYQKYILFKTNQTKTIKESSQKLLEQLDELKFPNLETIIQKYYPSCLSSKSENSCHICGTYTAKNARALSAHIRGCEKKIKPTIPPPENIVIDIIQKY